MDIREAAKIAKEKGVHIKRPKWDSAIYYDDTTGDFRWASSDDTVDMTPARLLATDYEVAAESSDASIYAYYDKTLNRWRSTTTPEKRAANGFKVAVFEKTSDY